MFRNRKFNKGFIVMPLVLLISATAVFLLYVQDDEAEIVRGKWSYYKTPKLTSEEISKSALQSVMINFELLGGDGLPRPSAEVFKWLLYAVSEYGSHPAYVKVGGKPVFVIFASGGLSNASWEEILSRLRADGLEPFFLGEFGGEWARLDDLGVFDGLYQYNVLNVMQSNDQVASSLGLPISAVERINLSFDFIERTPVNLPSNDIRRQDLFNRTDILAALSEYEAAQSALQLEIAKQYPDIRVGPGYNLDDAKDKWTFGLSVTLPIFNRNEGPIAEAEARRKESAAQFVALQARVIGEIDRKSASYNEALKKLQVAEADHLAFKEAQMKLSAAELSRLEAFIISQQSLRQLEDAVRHPPQFIGAVSYLT